MFSHMKTTVDLDEQLLRLAKQHAAASGLTLRAYIENALRAQLLPTPERRAPFKLEVPIVEGARRPAVEVADRDALYDLMERD